MELEELKEFYRTCLEDKEIRKLLDTKIKEISSLGEINVDKTYFLLMDVAKEKKVLNEKEFQNYQIRYFNAKNKFFNESN